MQVLAVPNDRKDAVSFVNFPWPYTNAHKSNNQSPFFICLVPVLIIFYLQTDGPRFLRVVHAGELCDIVQAVHADELKHSGYCTKKSDGIFK